MGLKFFLEYGVNSDVLETECHLGERQLGLVTQPLDEATGDLWVEMRMLICSDLKGSDE